LGLRFFWIGTADQAREEKLEGKNLKAAMKEMDKDGSGAINFEEFVSRQGIHRGLWPPDLL